MRTVEEILASVRLLNIADQMRLLRELPAHLEIPLEKPARGGPGESAFAFWDNSEDDVYDALL